MQKLLTMRLHGARSAVVVYNSRSDAIILTKQQLEAQAAAKRKLRASVNLYTRPNLSQALDNFDVKQQVATFTAAAASNPHLYVMQLAKQRVKQMEEEGTVNWNEIL